MFQPKTQLMRDLARKSGRRVITLYVTFPAGDFKMKTETPELDRLVVHCKKSPYDVLIDRTTKWGNPYSHKKGTLAKWVVPSREIAVLKYWEYMMDQVHDGKVSLQDLAELENKVLGCWCAPKLCHGHFLSAMAVCAGAVITAIPDKELQMIAFVKYMTVLAKDILKDVRSMKE